MRQARQGDVVLLRVDTIPAVARPVPRDGGRVVLAYGEATGHAHAIADPEVSMFEVDEWLRYLDVQTDAHLRHEEHGVVPIPSGKYRVIRQRQYAPDRSRFVAD